MSNRSLHLQARIEYQFQNQSLLNLALTHCSVGPENNERLEFLGDSILNFVVADHLYQLFPTAKEGELSRLRAQLVKGETLAAIAVELELGASLVLGEGEKRSGGESRESILADALESVLGAIFKEAGLDATRGVILRLLANRIAELSLTDTRKDSKSLLQELLQSQQKPLPVYEVVKIEGEGHAQLFTVRCQVAGYDQLPEARATSRKKAEKLAAKLALDLLNTAK